MAALAPLLGGRGGLGEEHGIEARGGVGGEVGGDEEDAGGVGEACGVLRGRRWGAGGVGGAGGGQGGEGRGDDGGDEKGFVAEEGALGEEELGEFFDPVETLAYGRREARPDGFGHVPEGHDVAPGVLGEGVPDGGEEACV